MLSVREYSTILVDMKSQTVKNLSITLVVFIMMAIISCANKIHTYQQSALMQWEHVESAFMGHAQLISRLPFLVPEKSLNKEKKDYVTAKAVYPTLTDQETKISYITEQKIWLDNFLSQAKIKKILNKKSKFIPVYEASVKPKLLRETTDYNEQVRHFNTQLDRPWYRFLGRLKGLSPLPYLSIGTITDSIIVGEQPVGNHHS